METPQAHKRFAWFLSALAILSLFMAAHHAHGQTNYPLLYWQNPVANQAALPLVGNVPGDARVDTTSFSIWIWNGSAWTQNAGTGTVTNVTGTLPIVITGTSTVNPNVTINQAATAASGYLSAADWNTFNNKQPTLTIGNLTDAGTDGLTVTSGTGAVIGSGTSLSQHVADVSHNGYLSSTDWSTFNGKQPTLTIGNLTDAGTDGITVTNGTGSVIGTGTSFAQHVADASHNGYLFSTDWSTFNGKQAAGSYITALTGDVTATGPGSVAATLKNTGAGAGSCTNCSVTFDAQGRETTYSSSGAANGLTYTAIASSTSLSQNTYNGVDTSSARTLTMPSPGPSGVEVVIKDATGSAATNNVTVNPNGSETFDGDANFILSYAHEAFDAVSNGTNWTIRNVYIPALQFPVVSCGSGTLVTSVPGFSICVYTSVGSDTFTITSIPVGATATAEILVVAGGAGGGSDGGGGGGGAGVYHNAAFAVGATGYATTVGASGAGGIGTQARGGQGGDSSFSTLKAGGGGGGGFAGGASSPGNAGTGGGSYNNGGSGGGGGEQGNAGGVGGAGTTAAGASGGSGNVGPIAGGGGGMAGNGTDASGTAAGNGAGGATFTTCGSSATYGAGGGGGTAGIGTAGTGGAGGGGNGSISGAGSAATGNGNGGGGGRTGANNGGNGTSGKVCVKIRTSMVDPPAWHRLELAA